MLWLEALGNAGSPDAVARVVPYLVSDDEAVRAAAVSARRKVGTPEAISALAEVARSDSEPWVRAEAARILASSSEPSALTAALDVLRSDPDPDVRRAIVSSLGAQLGGAVDATARAALAWIAEHDAAQEVRSAALEFLSA